MEEVFTTYLQSIKGKEISSIGRIANMMWIGVGKQSITVNVIGRNTLKSQFYFHIQCPWRLLDEKNYIVLASQDIYSPSHIVQSWETFDWDKQGNNLFDVKAEKWFINSMPIYIIAIDLHLGDLTLTLSNGSQLQTFIDSSTNIECWRLVNREGAHLVVSRNNVQYE